MFHWVIEKKALWVRYVNGESGETVKYPRNFPRSWIHAIGAKPTATTTKASQNAGTILNALRQRKLIVPEFSALLVISNPLKMKKPLTATVPSSVWP